MGKNEIKRKKQKSIFIKNLNIFEKIIYNRNKFFLNFCLGEKFFKKNFENKDDKRIEKIGKRN